MTDRYHLYIQLKKNAIILPSTIIIISISICYLLYSIRKQIHEAYKILDIVLLEEF